MATNGVTSVLALMSASPVELVVIGGALRRVSEGMIGPLAEAMVSGLSADAVFLGADGVTADRGLCEGTAEQIALKRHDGHDESMALKEQAKSAVDDFIVKDRAQLRVRRALTGDTGVLGDLNAYVHQAHADAMPDEYRPYSPEAAAQYFAGVVDDDSHPIWIAEVDNFPVAYLEAEVRRPDNPFTHRTAGALRASTFSSRARPTAGCGSVAHACRGKHGTHFGVY